MDNKNKIMFKRVLGRLICKNVDFLCMFKKHLNKFIRIYQPLKCFKKEYFTKYTSKIYIPPFYIQLNRKSYIIKSTLHQNLFLHV